MRTPAVFALLAASLLPAQTTVDSAGLISGYLFDEPSHSLRPISGVPGAAYLGRAVLSGIDQALAAPGGRWAVTLRAGQTVLVQLANGAVSREWMPEGLIASYSAAAWSGDGKVLALYDAASRSLQRITVDPAVRVAETLTLDLEGSWKGMAANGDGSQVAITSGAEGSMRLSIVSGGISRTVFDSPLLGPITAAGGKFYVADEASAALLEVNEAAAPAWALPEAMSAIFASGDGKLLYAAAKASPRIIVYDLASRAPVREIATDLPAVSLLALSRDTLVLLNARRQKGDTLFVLDTQNDPAVYFVPAGDE